jgi:hypothetical protein
MSASVPLATQPLVMDVASVASEAADNATDGLWSATVGLPDDRLPEVPPDGMLLLVVLSAVLSSSAGCSKFSRTLADSSAASWTTRLTVSCSTCWPGSVLVVNVHAHAGQHVADVGARLFMLMLYSSKA